VNAFHSGFYRVYRTIPVVIQFVVVMLMLVLVLVLHTVTSGSFDITIAPSICLSLPLLK
jgi:hypothetical protein